jgi:hypothetical protein
MAMASIAVYDWPENWPDLLPFLLKLISDQTNMNGGESLIHSCSTQPDDNGSSGFLFSSLSLSFFFFFLCVLGLAYYIPLLYGMKFYPFYLHC